MYAPAKRKEAQGKVTSQSASQAYDAEHMAGRQADRQSGSQLIAVFTTHYKRIGTCILNVCPSCPCVRPCVICFRNMMLMMIMSYVVMRMDDDATVAVLRCLC